MTPLTNTGRTVALGCACWLLLLPLVSAAQSTEEHFEAVIERAETLAGEPHDSRRGELPTALRDLNYDTYRQIRFRGDRAIWRDAGLFSVQLFHSGFLFETPVTLNLIEDGEVRPLEFSSDYYSYDGDAERLLEADLDGAGHAGFRLHYPLNRGDYDDEFLVFLGASYFRLVGRDQGYGLSTRGLAIDTGGSQGEEFPAFREFWLVKPDDDANEMSVLALLDSPSLAGAYRFDIRPGRDVEVEVDARLFARRDVDKLGVAPLTSMFAHGDTSAYPADDFRPRVHDSEGLTMRTTAGEWIWRPLTNPRRLRFSRLLDGELSGFGLAQRERNFDAYLDMEARYDRRPSQWVEALGGDWGSGGVELVEIPTDTETNDNIVAYWVPDEPLNAGESRRFHYRTHTFGSQPEAQQVASVVRTRTGWAAIPGQSNPPPRSRRQFMVDFHGGELAGLDASQPVDAELTTSDGEIHQLQVQQLPDGDTWRASFRVQPEGRSAADMRLYLSLRGQRISETWSYVWYPDELR
ncbi:glucan biosynthesis protein [Halomonas sp. ML-15]|uniref:glucan biosynthesis protein n=1 Tax=Halomonas sp. ML-15 TaxID=2773305 RepID=UPI001CD18C22|nr:glucan biosynthesis protein G [Halomonas sp. ML-15]